MTLHVFNNAPVPILLIIIVAVSFAVYCNSLFNEFVYDDYQQIVANYALRDLGNLPRVFSEDVWSFMGGGQSNYYRPMMHTMYMINYALFGLKPWGFHLVNILVHAGVGVMVFFTCRRLFAMASVVSGNMTSFFAALLFATHPIHTEAVTWVACLPELSFTLFYLWSFYVYMGAVDGERIAPGRRGRFFLSVLLFFLASLYKETALTLPLLLVVYDYCQAPHSFRPLRYIKRYLPFLATAVIYLVLRMMVMSSFAPVKRHSSLNAYEYFINIFPLFSRYIEKLILPLNLKVYYVFHPISSLLTFVGAVSLVATLIYIAAAWLTARKNKLIFFNLMFIVIPLLPVLYIPALGENTFTERYLYLPSVGFVFLIAQLVNRLCKQKPQSTPLLLAAVLTVAFLYSGLTVTRNMAWKNELTLWLDAVEKSPDGVLPHNQLANAYLERGDTARALEQYRLALQINPDFADTYTNIGLIYSQLGLIQQAVEYYEKALNLKPASPEGHNNIGVAYLRLGMFDKAESSFLESLKLNRQQPGVYNNLGDAYEKMGLVDKAIGQYQRALQIQEDNAEALNHLGIALAKKGEIDAAIGNFEKALQIDPDNAGFHNNIANAYSMKGLTGLAGQHRARAQALQQGK